MDSRRSLTLVKSIWALQWYHFRFLESVGNVRTLCKQLLFELCLWLGMSCFWQLNGSSSEFDLSQRRETTALRACFNFWSLSILRIRRCKRDCISRKPRIRF